MLGQSNTEVEVRYLIPSNVSPEDLRNVILIERIEQGYLELPYDDRSLRIRILDDKKAVITLKIGVGKKRQEFEEAITLQYGRQLLESCHHRIEKTRHTCSDGWEFDFFHGKLSGLIFAEFEMANESENFILPPWSSEWREVTDSLTNLHLARLNTELSDRGDVVDNLLRYLQPFSKIVLSGGPCSGKSTLIAELRSQFPELTIMPEMATLVISQVGIKPDSLSLQDFQKTIFRAQQIFEWSSAQMALTKGSRALIVDRGTMDNASYLPGGIPEFERLMGTTKKCEYEKYGLVLFLDMPPREIYNKQRENNPARTESYDDALPLSQRTKQVWQDHPHFVIVKGQTWEEKSATAMCAVANFLASLS